MTQQNNCPECGADSFKTVDYDRVVKEKAEIAYWYKKVNADHGLEKAEWKLERIRLEEESKHSQRKIRKQSNAIRNLEAKLKRLGQQPYKEEGLDEFIVRTMDGKICIQEKGKEEPDEPIPVG